MSRLLTLFSTILFALALFFGDGLSDDVDALTTRSRCKTTHGPLTACAILITKNEWPLLRSWILHHGDILGFENIHVIDNSDDILAVEYLRRSSAKYGISVNFSRAGMMQLSEEMTRTALTMRTQCDFIFKLDTDEFLAVHNGDGNPAMVEPSAFKKAIGNLPLHADKFRIPYSQKMVRQATCGDPALASGFQAIRTDAFPKHFFNAKTFTTIDLGSHQGAASSRLSSSPFLILHLQLKCHEVYIRNLKEALISQNVLSANGTDSEHLAALEQIKGKIEGRAMANYHKAGAYYHYLQNPEEVKRQQSEPSKDSGQVLFTGLRDRMQRLMVKYGDY